MIITIDGNIPSKMAHSFNVMKMAQGFFDAGEKVELVSLLSLPNIKEYLKIGSINDHYGISDNIRISLLPVYNRDFLTKRIFAKGFNEKAGKHIAQRKTNYAYCRSFKTILECVKRNIPCVLESHTTDYDNFDLKEVYKISNNPSFTGLVTIHESIKQEHVKRGIAKEKILVLEDGVDLSLYDKLSNNKTELREKLNLPKDKILLTYCGGLYREKGIEDILKLAKELQNDKRFEFILVGGSEKQLNEWKTFTVNHEIKNISFKGFEPNSKVPTYLKASDILLMPYPDLDRFDQMDINSTSPLKLFEYMAAQRPIITSKIPVIQKIIEHNKSGMLGEVGNIEQLSELVYQLIDQPNLSAKISKNAWDIVQKYSWKRRCMQIIDYYNLGEL